MLKSRIAAAASLAIAALVLTSAPALADHSPGEARPHQAPKKTRVRVVVKTDAMKGYNLYVTTNGFTWAPNHVNQKHKRGEGHAHLYVDGEKLTRLYGPAFYLGELSPGTHAVRVTLNGNDHGDYKRGSEVVESEVEVNVPTTTSSTGSMGSG
jgi:hypothetical protein